MQPLHFTAECPYAFAFISFARERIDFLLFSQDKMLAIHLQNHIFVLVGWFTNDAGTRGMAIAVCLRVWGMAIDLEFLASEFDYFFLHFDTSFA